MRRLRRQVTYANVMSSIAVFAALGGGAYAATQLPKNSVGTRQLKANAVTSSKVKDGSLLQQDFKAGQLPVGPAGPAGPAGKDGAAGAPATKYFAAVGTDGTLYGHGTATAATHVGTGYYKVTFGSADLTGCAAVAGVGYGPPAGSSPVLSYSGHTGPVLAFIAPSGTDTNEVAVAISDDDPTTTPFGTTGKVDSSFFLAVFC
jgi:hypothetical protein